MTEHDNDTVMIECPFCGDPQCQGSECSPEALAIERFRRERGREPNGMEKFMLIAGVRGLFG